MGSSSSSQRRSGRGRAPAHASRPVANPAHSRPANARPVNIANRPRIPPPKHARPSNARSTVYGHGPPPGPSIQRQQRPSNGKPWISSPKLIHSSTHGPAQNNLRYPASQPLVQHLGGSAPPRAAPMPSARPTPPPSRMPPNPFPPQPRAVPPRRPVPTSTASKRHPVALVLPRLPFQSPSSSSFSSSSRLAPLATIERPSGYTHAIPSNALPHPLPRQHYLFPSQSPPKSYPPPLAQPQFPPLAAIGRPSDSPSKHVQRILRPLPPLPLYSQHGSPVPGPVMPRSQSPFVPIPRSSHPKQEPMPRYPPVPAHVPPRGPAVALAPGYSRGMSARAGPGQVPAAYEMARRR